MQINRQELLSALERTMPGLAQKKDFIESYMNFSFDDNRIVTYNESVAVSVPIETGFTCSVPAKEFHNIIKKLNTPELDIDLDGGQLKIHGPNTKAAIHVLQDDKIKTATQSLLDLVAWKPLPSDFQDGVEQCGISTDMSSLMPWMKTLNIKGNQILSADSHRISQFIFKEPLDDNLHEELHIPFNSISGSIGQKFVEYYITKDWFHMRAEDGLVYSAKLMDLETVPDMEKYFDVTGDDFVLPEDSAKVIDLVAVMSEDAKGTTKWVKISITSKKVTFRCERQGTGWIEQELVTDYVGLPISFMLNPISAENILKYTRNVTISDKYCIFKHNNFQHIVALATDDKVADND
jgi:DNA polymerase III sliding clamp (beta) subunit (PCNA family)